MLLQSWLPVEGLVTASLTCVWGVGWWVELQGWSRSSSASDCVSWPSPLPLLPGSYVAPRWGSSGTSNCIKFLTVSWVSFLLVWLPATWCQGRARNGAGEVARAGWWRWEGWKGLSSSSWMLNWLSCSASLCDGVLAAAGWGDSGDVWFVLPSLLLEWGEPWGWVTVSGIPD